MMNLLEGYDVKFDLIITFFKTKIKLYLLAENDKKEDILLLTTESIEISPILFLV